MSLQSFQQALSELVMSPAFRAAAQAAPESAFAAFDLSARELGRLVGIARDPRLRTGTLIHRSFRLSALANALPLTCWALGPQGVQELVGAYWLEHLPRSYFYSQEALRFGEFVLARIEAGAFHHELLPEVLATEMAEIELAGDSAWEPPAVPAAPAPPVDLAGSAPGGDRDRGQQAADPTCWIARLHPLCRLVRFRRDCLRVLSALAERRPPGELAELPRKESYLLLLATGGQRVERRRLPIRWGRALASPQGLRKGSSDPSPQDLLASGYLQLAPREIGVT